jgi:hypothetical protein
MKINNALFPYRSSAITSASQRKIPSLAQARHGTYESRSLLTANETSEQGDSDLTLRDFRLQGLKLNPSNAKHDSLKPPKQ